MNNKGIWLFQQFRIRVFQGALYNLKQILYAESSAKWVSIACKKSNEMYREHFPLIDFLCAVTCVQHESPHYSLPHLNNESNRDTGYCIADLYHDLLHLLAWVQDSHIWGSHWIVFWGCPWMLFHWCRHPGEQSPESPPGPGPSESPPSPAGSADSAPLNSVNHKHQK